MTFAQEVVQLLRKYGQEISPEKAEEMVDLLRKTFGTLFSAAGVEWDENRILAAMERALKDQKPRLWEK